MLQISTPYGTVGSVTMKSKENMSRDVFDTLATQASLMTSPILTAEQKMAALTVAFLRLSNVDFQQMNENSSHNCCVHILKKKFLFES